MWTVRPAEFRQGNAPAEKAARGLLQKLRKHHRAQPHGLAEFILVLDKKV